MNKVFFLSICFFSFLYNPLLSDSAGLESIMDLSISLKELSYSDPEFLDTLISSDKYIILEGAVASIIEIERSENNLILDIHLINGEWIGLEKVEVYKCIINISGKEWEDRFPKRKPRELTSNLILQNNQILVIGKVSDYVMENSMLTAVIDAEYIRKIQ